MVNFLRKIFRFRTFLSILSIGALTALIFSYLSPFVHPETLELLPFFGLLYPIIALVNIFILFFWLFFNYRWSIAIAAFLLLGGKLHFRTLTFGSDDEDIVKTELHIMSFNVRLFDLYNSDPEKSLETKSNIFNYLLEKHPDIVCFQEFYHQDKPTKFITKDTLIDLLQCTDYHTRYAHKLSGRQNFGIAMFSKYPIINKGDLIFTNSPNSNNFCIYADIVKNKDTFRIYNVHLQSIRLEQNEYALFDENNMQAAEESSNFISLIRKIKNAYPVRANQVLQLTEHIASSPYPVIVCGDFNDTPMSYCYNQFNSILTDAYRNTSSGIGRTYAGKIPAGRIDYIFHSNTLGSKLFNIQEQALSDHYAIDCKVFSKEE